MPKTTISPVLLSEEYQSFIPLFDDEFPTTYDRWLENSAKESAKRIAQGYIIKEVVIHPQEFADYCRACGQNTSLTMLNGFAAAKAARSP
jgi:hypothetical protein